MAELCEFEVSPINTESEGDEREWCSELDHIPLIQRREMLLADPNIIRLTCDNNGVIQQRTQPHGFPDFGVPSDSNSLDKMNPNSDIYLTSPSEVNNHGVGLEKVDANFSPVAQDMTIYRPSEIKVELIDSVQDTLGDIMGHSLGVDMQVHQFERSDSIDCTDNLDNIVLLERLKMLPPRKMVEFAKPFEEESHMGFNLHDRLDYLSASADNMTSSVSKVKPEPSDDFPENMKHNAAHDYPFISPNIKNEPEISNAHEEMIGRVQLGDGMRIQTIGEDLELRKFDFLMSTVHTDAECGSTVPETSKAFRISRPGKRKKTATDSVETALEEDAPGLLQALIVQGISVDEIKLYGEVESDELIDDSLTEDEFSELESVISKHFFQRNSLLKFASLRCAKGSKPIYCLGCLFSLVEQTRYLRFRNWPAEWGWCRDLQCFIFVFERHRRIVLERPEYGYATYFFELVASSPIDWQIKRLVTAMKLTSCGRIGLIEDKPLVVGEDLMAGEAQVLMQFGWTPNSGLGTMLNYCNRVVHDKKNDKDVSEWRSKIGKLLVDGYNSGGIVSGNVECKAMEDETTDTFQVKVEEL